MRTSLAILLAALASVACAGLLQAVGSGGAGDAPRLERADPPAHPPPGSEGGAGPGADPWPERTTSAPAAPAPAAPAAAPSDTIVRPDLWAPRLLRPLGADARRLRPDLPPWIVPDPTRPADAVRLLRERLAVPGAPGGPPERPTVRLGLKELPVPWLQAPPPPGVEHPLLQPRVDGYAPRWSARIREVGDSTALARAALERSLATLGRRDEMGPAFLPPDTVGRPRRAPRIRPFEGEGQPIPGLVSDLADLGISVSTRAELGGDWSRFRPCQDRFQETCNPRLLPQVQPDLQFDVQVGGTIAERIHVDVDFDQTREFDAANTINIWYDGAEDDVIRRLEVGDVTFALPRSRFVTQGLPAGNFGFRAQGQLGPLDFQGVWAEQRGTLNSRSFQLTGVGNQQRFVQEDTLVLDDADYARGQFFFLVDPRAIDRFPHVDVLSLDAGSAPASVLPGVEPVQLYRFEADPVLRQQVEGFIQADAVAEGTPGSPAAGDRVVESGWFRYLQPGQDYFVHPSGLWVALRNPLAREEMLAVTYVTAAGDTIGDYNPERIYAQGGRPELRLLKAPGAVHQPGRATWEREMHNVYRVSGAPDVEQASVGVTISLGQLSAGRTFVRGPRGEDITWLQLMGLDQESPLDEVDKAFVYQPGRDVFQEQPPVEGTYVVFPTLEPFKRPPPVPALGLTEEDTRELLGDRANATIYDDPDPFERDNGGRFRLTIPFRVRSEGVISSFSLGAIGVRDGSERIFLGDRLLVRGVDYQIDYDIGQVRLLEPEVLFATRPDAEVRATWEQKQIFRTAPISVFGFQSTARLGDVGALNFVGLYRTERTLATRPTLGVEPGAVGIGGFSGNVSTRVGWLDRALAAVPGIRPSGSSTFSMEGEAAMALPDPNTQGDVFLDDFDASDERPLSLLAGDWSRGSAPAFRDGAQELLPANLDAFSLAEAVWQHQWIVEGVGGDSLGIHEGFLPRDEIDQRIRVAGSQVREPGLQLTLGSRGPGPTPGRRWASITTLLSQTGTDLTRSEFLEVYVRGGSGADLILDLGEVGEDAFFADPENRTEGVQPDGTPWGLGRLDQEADPSRGEIWGDEADELGVWGESCRAEPGQIYRLGDVRAVCTRNNGVQDTEDLDGNGNLGVREKHLRYVVRLNEGSPFLVRNRDQTGTAFRLFRIPLQGPNALEVGGAFTDADLRSVKHLRVTVTADRETSLTLARLRIIGSRWVKRADRGILSGFIGDTVTFPGRLEVTPVSRLTEGSEYSSPPGVLEQLADPTSAIGTRGVEFNEKSLALRFDDLPAGARAEVFNRFPQRPRNFLDYRSARFWVVAREGDFGRERPNSVFLKVGTDPENFYLFKTPIPPPPPGGGVTPEDWLPEVEVTFGLWITLRREAEEILIENPRQPGDPPVVVWSEDGQYAVVLQDRGRAPDLANVRELSLGVWNEGDAASGPLSGEVWFDELRLSRPLDETGLAGFFSTELDAGGVLSARATWSSEGAFFHQLDQTPSYQTEDLFSLSTRLNVERFLPSEWGVEIPVSVDLERASQDPRFLENSDVRANRLPGLRTPSSDRTRVSVSFRKVTPSADPVLGALLDGLDGTVAWYTSDQRTVTSRLESQGVDARLGWDRRIDRRDVPLVPGFLEPVVRALLPGFVEDDVVDARLRWTPERLSLGTGYARQQNDIYRFEQIVRLDRDSLVQATRAPRESLESAAEVAFRPLTPLTAQVTFLSTRDLLEARELVADPRVRELLEAERRQVGGMDLGWETQRQLRTRLAFRPNVVPWLQHDFTWSTSYLSDRNATFVERIPLSGAEGADTLLALQRNASGDRNVRATLSFDPGGMARDLLLPEGPSGDEDAGPPGAERTDAERPGRMRRGQEAGRAGPETLVALLERIRPVTFEWDDGLTSRFNRDPVSPGAGYQLGFGTLGDFRFLDGDTAAAVTDRSTTRVGTGVLLPFDLDVTVAWSSGEVDILDVRSDRTVRTETWPDVRVRTQTPAGIPGTPVERLSLATGYQENEREIAFGGAAQQRRLQTDRRVPFEVSLGWAGFASVTYSGSVQVGEGEDPTGDTERDGRSHRLAVTSTFVPPGGLASRLDRPVNLSLIGSWQSERECRVARFRDACVAFVDQINRGLSLNLDTALRGFDVGLNASWTDRQSGIGELQGSTQFQLGVWGRFLFRAGTFPEGSAAGEGAAR